jgi:putative flippase GtrA
MTRTLKSQFVRFAAVGVAGLVVDTAVLYGVLALGAGLYSGRLVSYFAAATATWALNRRFTFGAHHNDAGKLAQWAKFLAANALGGLVNYGVYAALVATSPLVATMPVIAVGAGSLAGLAVNFTLSRRFVFRIRDAQRAS